MKLRTLVTALVGAALLTIIYWSSDLLLNLPQGQIINFWSFIANFLITVVLGYYILNSNSSLVRTSINVFLIYFIIGHFNLLIEAYIFNITDRAASLREIFRGLFIALIFSPIYTYILYIPGNQKREAVSSFVPRSFINWFWRILLGDSIYLFLYIGAGLILSISSPEIMKFYEGKLPSFDLMIKTQLFLRGFLFVGIALLIIHSMYGSVWKKAIYIGVAFSTLGALAPLIPPNELMPGFVRLGHGIEVSLSNFLYGLILGFLFKQTTSKRPIDTASLEIW